MGGAHVAQLIKALEREIHELVLRQAIPALALDDVAQSSVKGVGRAIGPEHGASLVDELEIEIHRRAGTLGCMSC